MDGISIWYFAYGSNMSAAVMSKRGLKPQGAENVIVHSHILVFDVFGVPYTDPAMAGIRRKPAECSEPSVHGVAYLLSAADYSRLKISEGAGTGYQEVTLEAEIMHHSEGPGYQHTTAGSLRPTFAGTTSRSQPSLMVTTLLARNPFEPVRMPSVRYMVRTASLLQISLASSSVLTGVRIYSLMGLRSEGCRSPTWTICSRCLATLRLHYIGCITFLPFECFCAFGIRS
ncbi:uncharacterized protein E0L32_011260 [Thyridium curvatum]|uniref:gamma-glutamylcyclotransferase n=1 Tax=Thyridium curvatum TaxID=1093900 RepID=A0A507BHX3_9PEZI|nr:uncharacterized protein E0L32_011260 [Thyridium curvatum]TPX19016.1 hypothetical protein E0L32_011260 [Thyridium curvatum]